MADKIKLTKAGKEELEKELRYLIDEAREEVKRQLAEARAQGDLSENADYDAARNRQAEVEVADTEFVLSIMPKPQLEEFHKQSDNCIKFIDVAVSKKRVTEQEAVKTVKVVYNEYQISDSNQCSKQQQYDIVSVLKKKGLSVRQIERLTGITHWIAQKG